MFDVTPVKMLGIAWGAVTFVLTVFYIRRGILSQHEEDQLFLDKAEDHIRKEQEALVARIMGMDKIIFRLGIVSGVLLLVWAGVWVYVGLTTTTAFK
jgi:hypothetical protein